MTTLLSNRAHRATEHSLHVPAWAALLHAARGGLRLLADRMGDYAAACQRRSRAAASERALRALDDRTLRDLGFHRSEIISIAHDPADLSRARSAGRAEPVAAPARRRPIYPRSERHQRRIDAACQAAPTPLGDNAERAGADHSHPQRRT